MSLHEERLVEALIILGIIAVIAVVVGLVEAFKDKSQAQAELYNLRSKVDEILTKKKEWEKWQSDTEAHYELLQKESNNLNTLVSQRSKNFPLLGEVYKEYYDVKAQILMAYLANKSHPAISAADAVKEINREKRELIQRLKLEEYKVKNYELIAPFLTELEDEEDSVVEQWAYVQDYDEEETQDEVTHFVTKEEYRQLGVAERNQLALDRYWERRKKSKWLVGKMYEQYVGYLYESQGWQVEYFGIKMRYEDAGRDLIARKGSIVHIVQCKNWSRYKEIFENHIFQLFGTTYEYQQRNPKFRVVPIFFASTGLSSRARMFSDKLDIKVFENKKLVRYPCIKCNVNPSTKDKIYHLPFDQQYDNAKIDTPGEKYVTTVKEAEALGFRRAYRWRGQKAV